MKTLFASTSPQRRIGHQLGTLGRSLATPLLPVDFLEWVDPLRFGRSLRGRVEGVIDETADARTLVIRPGQGWKPHQAGQFVRLDVDIDGVRHTRCYSISSAPERDDGCFTVTVKAVPGGRVSEHLERRLRPGALVHLSLPEGEFVLPEPLPGQLLFITAGSGITPVASMLRSLAARGQMPDVVLLHYAPTAADAIFREELAALAQRFARLRIHWVNTRAQGDSVLHGHFRATHLAQICPDWKTRTTYACGPAALLASIESARGAHKASSALHLERFQPVLATANAGAQGGEVRFARSGRLAQADGSTPLLEVAESAGLAPAHGCRMGICHGCTARLKSGCVRDLRTGHTHGDTDELIQICVSAAAGDVEIEL